jgi:TIR domain
MTKSHTKKVFVSHCRQDREFVEKELLALIRACGVETWYAPKDISTADEWHQTILRGLETCSYFLVVLSTHSVESEWVKSEVDWATKHRWPGRLIPVIIEPCDTDRLHLWLSRLQHVDFVVRPSDARERLSRFFELARVHSNEASPPPTDADVAASESVAHIPIRVPLFHFGGVVPPECFVGRDRQLREAERIIRDGQNFILVGNHRDGKTSLCKMLIHQMMRRPDNSVLAVYLNVQLWPDVNIETFLEHTILSMIGEIGRQVFRIKFTALRDVEVATASGSVQHDIVFHSFVNLYRHVRTRTYSRSGRAPQPFRSEEFQHIHGELLEIIQAKGWSHCVVIYDEANKLTNDIPVERLVSHEEVLTVPGRVSVYAATPAMVACFGRLRDTFAHEVVLKPFDRSDVQNLLLSYWSRTAEPVTDLPVTADAVDAIWKLTDGQPYRVQFLAGRSFVVANESGDSIVSRSHVATALERLRKEKPEEFAT